MCYILYTTSNRRCYVVLDGVQGNASIFFIFFYVDPRIGGIPKDSGQAHPWFCTWLLHMVLGMMVFTMVFCKSGQGNYGYVLVQG